MIFSTVALEAIRAAQPDAAIFPSSTRGQSRVDGSGLVGTVVTRGRGRRGSTQAPGAGGGGAGPEANHPNGGGIAGPSGGRNVDPGGGGDSGGHPSDGGPFAGGGIGAPTDPGGDGGGPPAGGGDGGGGGDPPGQPGGIPGPMPSIPDTDWVRMLRRIGLSDPAIRLMVMDEAVDGSEELISLSSESVDRLFTRMDARGVIYSTVVHNRYRLLHHLMRRLTFSGLPIVLQDVNVDLLRAESLILQAEPPKGTKSKIPLPGKFKDEKDWISFQNALSNYLKSVRGMGMVPLTYVLRPSGNAMPLDNSTDPAILNAPHHGPMFIQDNREVYCILDELTCKGPGETIVRKYRVSTNGRAAFLELHAHFSGGSYKTIKVKQANDVVKGVKFNGHNQNFSFETFRRMFADAYRDLEEANQGVPQQTQVLNFLDAITMPELQTAVTAVHSNDEYLVNFEKASSFLAGIAVRMTNRKGLNTSRNVASVDTRSRSPDEWKKLSKDERDKIIKARREGSNEYKESGRKVAEISKSTKRKNEGPNIRKGIKSKGTSILKSKRKVAVVDTEAKDEERTRK